MGPNCRPKNQARLAVKPTPILCLRRNLRGLFCPCDAAANVNKATWAVSANKAPTQQVPQYYAKTLLNPTSSKYAPFMSQCYLLNRAFLTWASSSPRSNKLSCDLCKTSKTTLETGNPKTRKPETDKKSPCAGTHNSKGPGRKRLSSPGPGLQVFSSLESRV